MIIRIIATALIQCTARTHPGWITLAGTVVARSSLAVMLDMARPFMKPVTIIRLNPSVRYCDIGNQTDFTSRHSGAPRSDEPGMTGDAFTKKRAGLPRLACSHPFSG